MSQFKLALLFSFLYCSWVNASDNYRAAIDLSGRSQYDYNTEESAQVYSLGLDYQQVFTNEYGDTGELLLQLYLNRIDNLNPHPPFYDSDTDWQLTCRICTYTYKGFGLGKPRLKLGHIELPFGLENVIGTNGNLLDYNHGRNLGMKADWGLGLQHETRFNRWEVSATTASGQELDPVKGNYALSGRAGFRQGQPWSYGVSLFQSEADDAVRTRAALDSQWYWRSFSFLSELAGGERQGYDQRDALIELQWLSPVESWLLYSRWQYNSEARGSQWLQQHSYRLGLRYEPDNHWSLSTDWHKTGQNNLNAVQLNKISAQIRYRW